MHDPTPGGRFQGGRDAVNCLHGCLWANNTEVATAIFSRSAILGAKQSARSPGMVSPGPCRGSYDFSVLVRRNSRIQ
jgi:hypothetical protein